MQRRLIQLECKRCHRRLLDVLEKVHYPLFVIRCIRCRLLNRYEGEFTKDRNAPDGQ